MSTIPVASQPNDMTAEAFFSLAGTWTGGERYELVEGSPLRLQSEQISHSEHKLSTVIALRNALRSAGLDCRAFSDDVSVGVNDRSVREPDALVHCGPHEGSDVFASNPIVVVEVISPSSIRTDPGRKLIDYFAVPSIFHHLILYGDDGRALHHGRASSEGEIATRICARGDVLDLSAPGISLTVEALFDS